MRPSQAASQARIALEHGDTTTARETTDLLLARFKSYPPALMVRILLAERASENDAALDDLKRVTSVEPANAEARAIQARLFQHRGDTDLARDAAQQVVDLVPNNPQILNSALDVLKVDADALQTTPAVIARIHLNCGWPELAERHARVAAQASPHRVDIRLLFAEILWRLNHLAQCEAECRVVTDQAEECIHAAVMRAHILSERGRTAEGQELLDRIGDIDPEFVEARKLLATLEVHRLVLPDMPEIELPENLRVRFENGHAMSHDRPKFNPPVDKTLAAPGSVDNDMSGAMVPSAAAEDNPESIPPTLDEADALASPPTSLDTAKSNAPPDSEHRKPSTTPTFSTLDWARDLMSRSEWSESEIVLKDLLEDHTLDTEALDKLFLEAVDHEPLRRTAWKLLGDHYMRTGRPQAATDAYLHASNTVDEPQL